jgi:hypothetical protein
VGEKHKGEKVMDTITLTLEEARALVKELEHIYISYENPVATAVTYRLMKFVKENENVGKS